MKRFLIPLLFFSLSISLFGQQDAANITPRVPRIEVSSLQKRESPVRISDVKVDVKVIGNIAVTTVDMQFYNPNNRILEGQLDFPLGDGHSISRFALDINGKLREGVVVDKAKGQQVFEDVIRQNVDPGLLEKTQGNSYRARVYPLPGKGTRRAVIAYEQELKKDKGEMRFHLPVQYGNNLDNFDLTVTVFSSPKAPKVEETPWGSFSFTHAGDTYTATYNQRNFTPQGQLVFTVPLLSNETVFVEQGAISSDTYFYANVQPKNIDILHATHKVSAVDIYWDASSSMAQRDIDKEFEFLDAYFALHKAVKVNLYSFNVLCDKVGTFHIRGGNTSALKKALKNIPYDGATQYGKLQLDGTMSETDCVLLFSDGMSNFGNKEATLGTTPVVVVNTVMLADHAKLKYMASVTNGAYLNLLQQTVDDAIAMFTHPGMNFLYAEYDKKEIADVVPSIPQSIKNDEVFAVCGRLKKKTARITLHFGINNKVLASETITINQSDRKEYHNVIERMWAQKKIAELDVYYERNKTEIEALGKRFGIVTRATSLIVLDDVADYVRYEILPPTDLLSEYNRLLAIANKSRVADQERESQQNRDQIERVVRMFDNRKAWWNKRFPKECKPTEKSKKQVAGSVDHLSVSNEETDNAVTVRSTSASVSVYADEAPDEVIVVGYGSRRRSSAAAPSAVAAKREDVLSDKRPAERQPVARIEMKKWDPDTPYMTELKQKSNNELYPAYLSIKEKYSDTPSFYLEVATLFEEKGLTKEALIILSNLAEMEVESYRLLRVLGNRLNQLAYTDYAIDIFEQVLKLRPNEPQSYRDLASVQAVKGEYQQAIDNYYEIVKRKWDNRFPEIEVIALEEMNRVIEEAERKKVTPDLSAIDDRLIYAMPIDIRIVLNWDTDNSDMDLWVIDPCGETCKYNNSKTHIGGLISKDFTQGYGPEEFLIRRAMPGKYVIKANYYGTREQTVVGPTTIYLDVYTRYSSKREEKQTITLRLSENKEVITIGEIVFED